MDITTEIRQAFRAFGPDLNFLLSNVSARYIQAVSANTLLLAKIDPDNIRLTGQWRSGEMLCYLHVQSAPLMADYAKHILTSASHPLTPNQLVPCHQPPVGDGPHIMFALFSTGFWHSLFSCDIHKHFPPLVLADDNQGPLPTLGPCGVQERCGFHNKVPCEHVKGQSNSRLSLSCSTKEKRRSTAWKRQSRTKSKTRERS